MFNNNVDPRFREAEKNVRSRINDTLDEKEHPYVGSTWDSRILPALKARAERESLPLEDYERRLLLAARVICDFHEALHTYGTFDKDKPTYTRFWSHQPINLYRSGDLSRGFGIDRDSLRQAAAKYVAHPEIQNAATDWYLMDALVFAELDVFAETHLSGGPFGINLAWAFAGHEAIKYHLYSVMFSILAFGIRYVVPLLATIYLALNEYTKTAIALGGISALYLIGRLISLPARWKARRKGNRLVLMMIGLYQKLGSSVISPVRFREALLEATSEGVEFDGALFAIIDRIIKRDDTAFVPFSE